MTTMLRISASIARLQPYEPGWPAGNSDETAGLGRASIYLASNENALGCSPAAMRAIESHQAVNRYPRSGLQIRHKLAEVLSLSVRNVVVGNGSDSIIGNVIRTFAEKEDEVLTSDSTYPSFSVQAKVHGMLVRTVPYKNWFIDLGAIAGAIRPATKIIYLPNPNNPSGTMFTNDEFREFHAQVPDSVLVILDQAYYEYALEQPGYPRLPYLDYENVITLRTFSKAYGLAGLRLGYGIACQAIIDQLLKTQLPFETNSLAEAAAVAALDDQEFIGTTVSTNRRNRAVTVQELQEIGFTVIPSATNFVMVVFASAAESNLIATELLKRGIVVRLLSSFGLPQCIRITIGTKEEMKTCMRKMAVLHSTLEEFGCITKD